MINSPVSCLPFGAPLSGLGGRQTNTGAHGCCSGNAAVCVSSTVASLAQNRGAGRESLGRESAPTDNAQKCQNVAEKHPGNNHCFRLCCITEQWFLFQLQRRCIVTSVPKQWFFTVIWLLSCLDY